MWSLGVLLVELYLGRPLFRAPCKMLLVKRIVSVLGGGGHHHLLLLLVAWSLW